MYRRDANLGLERAVGPLWKARRVPMESEMCPLCTFMTEHGGSLVWDLTIPSGGEDGFDLARSWTDAEARSHMP